MTRRRVRPEEMELWQQIAQSTDPLHKHRIPIERPKPPKPGAKPKASPAPIPRFQLGESAQSRPKSQTLPQTTAQRLQSDPVAMDNKAFRNLKRGKLAPEARIDLHGLTLDYAHPVLTRFILTSQARGLRLVLVITGKGSREDPYDPAPRRRGVLKRQVPLWLKQPPLSLAVLQVTEAHIKHGGAGAYYVYLRRTR